MRFCHLLTRYRERANLTKTELARKLGLKTASYIIDLEAGRKIFLGGGWSVGWAVLVFQPFWKKEAEEVAASWGTTIFRNLLRLSLEPALSKRQVGFLRPGPRAKDSRHRKQYRLLLSAQSGILPKTSVFAR